MGQVWSDGAGYSFGGPGLTLSEVEELVTLSKNCFTHENIESLYKRFRTLDRGKRGYLVSAELLSTIPELSINPLNKRIAYFCDGINFKEFVRILAPYSRNASREDKMKVLFSVWDVNGDGRVCKEDVELVIRQAAGGHLMDDEVRSVVNKVMHECLSRTRKGVSDSSGEESLSLEEFCMAMNHVTTIDLDVEIPALV